MSWEAGNPTARFLLDYSTTNVGPTTWVLVGALTTTTKIAEIYDSGGKTMELKMDSSAGGSATAIQMYIMPGGNGRIPLDLSYGTTANLYVRCCIAATTVSSGLLIINLFN